MIQSVGNMDPRQRIKRAQSQTGKDDKKQSVAENSESSQVTRKSYPLRLRRARHRSALPQKEHEIGNTFWKVYKNNKRWRIIGLVSSVVGLLCCALSHSFDRLINGWNAFKIILYGVLSLAIFITIIIAKPTSNFNVTYVVQRVVGFVVLMLIAVCTIYYDRAVDNKPEILSVVSNAAFALMSLCLSKLAKFSQEMGVFTAFLTCFTIQLWTIHWTLISVAIVYGCPLYVMHYSPDSREEAASKDQAGHSSIDTREHLDNAINMENVSGDLTENIGRPVKSKLTESSQQHSQHSLNDSSPSVPSQMSKPPSVEQNNTKLSHSLEASQSTLTSRSNSNSELQVQSAEALPV